MNQSLKLFGAEVRRRRKALGISQEKLAEFAEIDPTYVGQVERAETNASLLIVARLAKALRVSVAELVEVLPL